MQRSTWVPLLLCLATVGCTFTSDMARDQFSRRFSCPDERLGLKSVPVRPEELLDPGEPPADVAADAGRLAVWQANRIGDMQFYEHLSAIEVRGCGHRVTYLCWDERNAAHETIDTFCEPVDLNSPHTKLGSFQVKPRVLRSIRDQLLLVH